MSVSTDTFWKLLEESRLLTIEQLRELAGDFSLSKPGAAEGTTLADWLVSRNVLSRYQATILLAGRSGPFLYGDYGVYDRIDRGRLAGWFRAVHRPTGHPVLLQFLAGSIAQNAAEWLQASQLALAACHLHSPQLQRFYEPVDLGTYKFLVSEDLRGRSAEERLAEARLEAAEACRLARLAAIGLAQLHQAGRVHGDVRPANLWLENPVGTQPANLKLLYEPHVARGPLPFADPLASGALALVADFAAPELAQPGKSPDLLSDIYALGCTLYLLLTGIPPFAGGNVQQKLVRHATEPIRPLEQFGVPQPLAQLVAFMMAKNPSIRFQSAAIVAEQLTPFVEPQVHYLNASPPAATLAGYESWLRQRQMQPPAPAAAPAPAPAAAPAPVSTAPVDLKVKPAAEKPLVVAAEGTATRTAASLTYQAARKQRQTRWLIASGIACAILLGAGIYVANWLANRPIPGDDGATAARERPNGERGKRPRPVGAKPGSESSAEVTTTSAGEVKPAVGPANPPGDGEPAQQIVPDDGKLLWASPTSGEPVPLRLVPPEGQVFIISRPAAILASPEGAKVLAALGPDFAAKRAAWESTAGVPLEQVERLIIGLHNNEGQFPRTSFVVRTKEAIGVDQLVSKWGQPQEQKEGSMTWYAGEEWGYLVSQAPEDERTFLMAAPNDVKEVAKVAGAPPVLLRDVERLRRSVDGDRHVTILFYPPFLFNDDGQPLFGGPREKVRPALGWFLGDGLQASLVSLHFGDSFYFEMRMLGSLDKEKYELATELRERLKIVPAELENYMDRLTPPTYWSKLARRYPLMVGALHGNMRVGVENDQAVVNSYLEGPAAHSLVLGGELLVASAPGTAVVSSGPPAAAGPKNIDEVLTLKTSMSFDAQSLEFAMRDIAEDVRTNLLKGSSVPFEIKLMGKDMERDGITRNQTIRDFKEENKTVAEVLTAMVMKANAPNVPDPSMPDQKLVWVVAPDPDQAEREIVLITTRAAAERDKYTLPAPFRPK